MIKLMTINDIPRVKDIFSLSFDKSQRLMEYYKGFEEYIDFSIKQGYAFVICNDVNEIIGFINGYEIPDMMYGKTLYIENLAVIPCEQRKGYGKALMNQIEKTAKSKGIREISLRTLCYMESYAIYLHLGFIDQRSDSRYLVKKIT